MSLAIAWLADHGLGSHPLITAADAIDLRGRPSPDSFERAVTLFAKKGGRAGFLQDFLVAIDRQFAPGFPLPIFQRLHLVVESLDRDVPFVVVQSREQARQRRDWIRHRAAEHPRVQIHLRAGHFDLQRSHAAQTVTQRRHSLCHHSGIGNDRDIAPQRFLIFREKISQIAAADFFFALDHEMQVDRQIAVLLERFLDPENVRENLPFVVGRAARKNVAVFQHRIERRRIPQIERIGRLHIVMSVNHDGAAPGLMFVLRPDHRMARCRTQASSRARCRSVSPPANARIP